MAVTLLTRSHDHGSTARVYDPLDPVVKQEPDPFYAKLRRDDPVTWLPSLQAFGVARYEDVDALLKNGKLYSSSMLWPALLGEYDPVPEVPPMISMDPPGHVHLRKLANKAFVPSKIKILVTRNYEVANELIDDKIGRAPV